MSGQNYTRSFTVDQSPEAVFEAINNPQGWWSEAIEGHADQLGGVWKYHYQDLHRATFKTTELVPGKKVVWHCVKNYFNFVADKTEWTGTDVVFEISTEGDKTAVTFTHVGLVPAYECYTVCSDAWGGYVGSSLRNLITTGKATPNTLEGSVPPHQEIAAARARQMISEA